ncbi:13080_t:CDS:2 [Gigaspora margarita]|uniref:13080_t:CDS:1 n=1 Tax=Gigaspora margarita TaxID=4874 RepID=A0ABN7UFA6_GIGMA|nr:13080_t:CDS:2 [Gigaspora margarita]
MCERIEAYGCPLEHLHRQLKSAYKSGDFLSEYNNGIVCFKPFCRWTVAQNTRYPSCKYPKARGGFRLIGHQFFDERVPSENLFYTQLLRRESKGRTNITGEGYQHGRPLNIDRDPNRVLLPSTCIYS